jgi:DnaJ-class molecular chaperone
MAASKTPATVTAEPAKCPTCKGSGEVSRTVHVGRKCRPVCRPTGICLTCLGSGEATD